MPGFDLALNLHGLTITKTSGFNPLIHDLSCHHEPHCPRFRRRPRRPEDLPHCTPVCGLDILRAGHILTGGDGGIRTLDTRLTYTPLAGERLQPLGHVSFPE